MSWAIGRLFADVQLTRPGGTLIDWKKTKYADDYAAGIFDPSGTFVLLHRTGSNWTVSDSATGPTDIAWDSWRLNYRLPSALFER